MTLTDKLAEMREKAEKATPGPYRGDRPDGTVKYSILGKDGLAIITGDNNGNEPSDGPYGIMWPDDEAYLLACSPERIRALVEVAMAAESEIDCMYAEELMPTTTLALAALAKAMGEGEKT